jgi:hypothetical protein
MEALSKSDLEDYLKGHTVPAYVGPEGLYITVCVYLFVTPSRQLPDAS